MECQLIRACERGDLKEVKRLVKRGANIHWCDNGALVAATYTGHLEVIKYLHKKGANIHLNDDEICRCAAQHGHLDIVKYAVEKGANIRACNDHALRWAAHRGYLDIVKFIVEKGAERSWPLDNIRACKDGAVRHSFGNGNILTFSYLSNFYKNQELNLILPKKKHVKFQCFYMLMYFFYNTAKTYSFWRDHVKEKENWLWQNQASIWDGNIGLIVASFLFLK